MSKYNLRWLHPEEYESLEVRKIFLEQGTSTPLAGFSNIAVLETPGEAPEIIGLCTFQMCAHAEPIWIREDMRGQKLSNLVGGMVDDMLHGSGINTVFTTPNNEASRALALKFGFSPYGETFIKQYNPILSDEE